MTTQPTHQKDISDKLEPIIIPPIIGSDKRREYNPPKIFMEYDYFHVIESTITDPDHRTFAMRVDRLGNDLFKELNQKPKIQYLNGTYLSKSLGGYVMDKKYQSINLYHIFHNTALNELKDEHIESVKKYLIRESALEKYLTDQKSIVDINFRDEEGFVKTLSFQKETKGFMSEKDSKYIHLYFMTEDFFKLYARNLLKEPAVQHELRNRGSNVLVG